MRLHAPGLSSGEIREHLKAAEAYEPPDPLDTVRDAIKCHQENLDEAPDAPEAPVLLEAMGNLYSLRLGDYQMAVNCYQDLLLRYPEYHKGRVYVNMATAYEKAGDMEMEEHIYTEMMREFPKGSAEYQIAAEEVSKGL